MAPPLTSDEPRNAELDAAIIAHPDDPTAYGVLADWLSDRGHPRGELIALQLRAETEPELVVEADTFLAAHEEPLLGRLRGYQHTREQRRRPVFTWRRGFIDRVLLAHHASGWLSDDPTTLAELLERLLAHPSGRFLRGVDVGVNGSVRRHDLEDVIALLATAPHVQDIFLGDFADDQAGVSWFRIGNLEPLWSIPHLRTLRLRGGAFELGTISHPELEQLSFETSKLGPTNAQHVATAKVPRLHHLGFPGAPFVEELFTAFVDQPISRQLRSLDLSSGKMSDAGARALVAARSSLVNVERLEVSGNRLSAQAIELLRGSFPEVVSTG